jgi:hypothetical protein
MFLAAMAAVGALDKWHKDHMAGWMLRGGAQRLVDGVIVAAYAVLPPAARPPLVRSRASRDASPRLLRCRSGLDTLARMARDSERVSRCLMQDERQGESLSLSDAGQTQPWAC